MDSKINKALLKKTYFTILYLNCLNHPPTTFEVWRHFMDLSDKSNQTSFEKITLILENLKKEKKIFLRNGFWVIKGEEVLSKKRIIREKSSLVKLRRIKRSVNILKFLPFIRGVFIAGTISFQTASKDSDWDVLLIMKKNRIWLGRLIVTAFLYATGQKRSDIKIKDRFCLNHFLTENNLIPENRNEYTALEYGFIFPMLGADLFIQFSRLNWNWLRQFSPNFEAANSAEGPFLVDDRASKRVRHLFEISFEVLGAKFLNQFCKKWMSNRISSNPNTFKEGAVVIYNDGELAFWPDFKNLNSVVKW